jgi:hypothetical protein
VPEGKRHLLFGLETVIRVADLGFFEHANSLTVSSTYYPDRF